MQKEPALESVRDRVIFSAKEAVYKALNPLTGVYLGFQEVRLRSPGKLPRVEDGQSGRLEWELLKDSGPDFPPGTRGEVGWVVNGKWIVAGVWIKAKDGLGSP